MGAQIQRPGIGMLEARIDVADDQAIAITQIEDGRWERTDDGYRLVGKSLVPGPAPGPVRWPYAAAVIGCASLGFGFLIYRYRRMAPRRLS